MAENTKQKIEQETKIKRSDTRDSKDSVSRSSKVFDKKVEGNAEVSEVRPDTGIPVD